MITFITIVSLTVWFIGALMLRFLIEIPPHNRTEPLGWKLVMSALWPIVVPLFFLIIYINNFLYDRRMKKLKKERQ